jgi:E3 Ubiquitin ligase
VISAALIDRSPDSSELLVFCVVGFCVGIALFFYGFRLLQRRRLILDTPLSKIRSASMGMVEISGLAVGPYTMVAPVTARACYYYRTLVWEWKQSGKNKQWVKIASECMHVPFFVDDGTGQLLVDPSGADLDLHRDFREEFNGSFFSSADIAPGNVNSFLARHGVVTSNKIKVEEYCIKPKNSLFILGTLAENTGLEITPTPVHDSEASGAGFSLNVGSFTFASNLGGNDLGAAVFDRMLAVQPGSNQPQIIRLSTGGDRFKALDMTQQQKIAAALTKAGISNPAAWTASGASDADVAAASDATAGQLQVISDPANLASGGNGSMSPSNTASATAGFDRHPPMVLRKGANNKTFLISWRSQREVAQSLGWKCFLMIWGGPILALISLYFFLGIRSLF